eukprot:Hpha_TRINITY_DN27772_c0_g1::TRINITY_DN27772_c0_g1_i1::g.157168::m.157168
MSSLLLLIASALGGPTPAPSQLSPTLAPSITSPSVLPSAPTLVPIAVPSTHPTTLMPSQAPTVMPDCGVVSLHASGHVTCVFNFDGRLRCWGENPSTGCHLGIGDSTNRGDTSGTMGVDLPFLNLTASNGTPGVAQFSVGTSGACFVSTSLSETKCWGRGDHGFLGGETNASVGCIASDMGAALASLPVPGSCTVVQIVPTAYHGCLLCSDMVSVYCWGQGSLHVGNGDNHGALGAGNLADRGGTPNWGSSW